MAKFINIYRDPRAVAYSLISKPWGANTALHAAQYWLDKVSNATLAGSVIGPKRFLQVCYETLVTNPHDEIERICAFLDIVPNETMFDKQLRKKSIPKSLNNIHPQIDQDINTEQIEKWHSLPKRDIQVIEALTAPLMDELGYEQIMGTGGRGVRLEGRLRYGLETRWRSIKNHFKVD
jgi:hypothetical protein